MTLGPRRAAFVDVAEDSSEKPPPLSAAELERFEAFDLLYRSLCALLYNYVPTSGHPGGSISSGRFVEALLFDAMDYDTSHPDRSDADIISYAAGHKALGLYAMWALRDEVMRLGEPALVPADQRQRLRLEDLLGFRRSPVTRTPLFARFGSKPLDGHPTPATPFVRLATGASGVGLPASLGLALAAKDVFGEDAPRVHIIEGEGGLTPGRVAEALAAAGTASLGNAILHVDWNQASIDSNRVCREGDEPGDYVQWNPAELAYLHDWNVILVRDGMDFQQIVAAQRAALSVGNGQPTAIVYRTTKGWQYGIEGRASHGSGHKLCSAGFHTALAPLSARTGADLPYCDANAQKCRAGEDASIVEGCFWEALEAVRKVLEGNEPLIEMLAARLADARARLQLNGRKPHDRVLNVSKVFEIADANRESTPADLRLAPGSVTTLRGELGRALGYLNKGSDGALLIGAADLLGSTSVSLAAKGFPEGFFNAVSNPDARALSIGGICEDAMAALMAGVSAYGRHIGVCSSYGAFNAPLGHIAARLHAIGNQARSNISGEPYRPFILVCAHAGLKTGEDGPTHADPQALQLLQENFPAKTMVSLTPWDPQEVWPLLSTALALRPAVIAPFVTRPNERVLDREALGLASASAARTGVYVLRRASGRGDGTLVLQESGVTYAFLEETLPLLQAAGVDLNVFYVASAELFDSLPRGEQETIFPEEKAREAMGITGFTKATMYRWILSERGRRAILHPFQKGHYLGSGPARDVLAEAGLDGASQYRAILDFIHDGKR